MQVKYKALVFVGIITIFTSTISGWSPYSTNKGIIAVFGQRAFHLNHQEEGNHQVAKDAKIHQESEQAVPSHRKPEMDFLTRFARR